MHWFCGMPGLRCRRAHDARSACTKAGACVGAAHSISSNTRQPPVPDAAVAEASESGACHGVLAGISPACWLHCAGPTFCPCPLFRAQCACGSVHPGWDRGFPRPPPHRLPGLFSPCGLHQHGTPTDRTLEPCSKQQGTSANIGDHWQHQ